MLTPPETVLTICALASAVLLAVICVKRKATRHVNINAEEGGTKSAVAYQSANPRYQQHGETDGHPLYSVAVKPEKNDRNTLKSVNAKSMSQHGMHFKTTRPLRPSSAIIISPYQSPTYNGGAVRAEYETLPTNPPPEADTVYPSYATVATHGKTSVSNQRPLKVLNESGNGALSHSRKLSVDQLRHSAAYRANSDYLERRARLAKSVNEINMPPPLPDRKYHAESLFGELASFKQLNSDSASQNKPSQHSSSAHRLGNIGSDGRSVPDLEHTEPAEAESAGTYLSANRARSKNDITPYATISELNRKRSDESTPSNQDNRNGQDLPVLPNANESSLGNASTEYVQISEVNGVGASRQQLVEVAPGYYSTISKKKKTTAGSASPKDKASAQTSSVDLSAGNCPPSESSQETGTKPGRPEIGVPLADEDTCSSEDEGERSPDQAALRKSVPAITIRIDEHDSVNAKGDGSDADSDSDEVGYESIDSMQSFRSAT